LKASRNEHGLLQAVICFENNNMKGQTSDGGSNENIHKGTVQVAAQYKLLKTERESMNKLHKNWGTLTRCLISLMLMSHQLQPSLSLDNTVLYIYDYQIQ
jgi:hypothetical protein